MQWALWPQLSPLIFFCLYPAIVLASVYGEGLTAIALSILLAQFFASSGFPLSYQPRTDLIRDIGFLVFALTIWKLATDRSQALENLRKERDRLRESEAALGNALRAHDEFLSTASHELKTPLTALKMQVEMRKRNLDRGVLDAFTPEALVSMLDSDRRQVDRLTRLIDDMLDLTRIRHGKLSIQLAQVDLNEVVRETVQRYRPQIDESEIAIQLELNTGNEPPLGRWDRVRIEQVMANLLTNAIKYGDGKPIEILTERRGPVAVLTVIDHGIGIAPEDQRRIFDRFERAIAPGEISGLGLGLYITRQIVELHGGRVCLESVPRQFTRFSVELPLSGADQAPIAPASLPKAGPDKARRA